MAESEREPERGGEREKARDRERESERVSVSESERETAANKCILLPRLHYSRAYS